MIHSSRLAEQVFKWGKGAIFCALILAVPVLTAQAAAPGQPGNASVVLPGNVPSFARPQLDYGFSAPSLSMDRMILALKPSPFKQAAMEHLLNEQQDPASPVPLLAHAARIGRRFGPSKADLKKVKEWLRSQGFRVDSVAKGRMWINFSGTVSQVEQAFHTQIHNYLVGGKMYHANATNPAIPKALATFVAGIVSLNNFPLRPMNSGVRPYEPGGVGPDDTSGPHYVSPGDFAAIYNVNALYNVGITGSGVTIEIVARTHPSGLLNAVSTFQSDMGLPVHAPNVILNGTDPGDLGGGEDEEAELDVEWSGAVARDATVDFVVSKSTGSTDGVDLSAQYIVDNGRRPRS